MSCNTDMPYTDYITILTWIGIDMTENTEIYIQRYETFRHLDKLRWQMMQIGVVAGSAVLALGQERLENLTWWTWAGIGFILLSAGISMMKIGHGIRLNGDALRQAAESIGDKDIPEFASRKESVSFWIAAVMNVLGMISIAFSSYLLICAR